MVKAGKQAARRGGSNGKVAPQKVVLVPKPAKVSVKYVKEEHFKRDARHVIHPPKYKDGVIKFSHNDINHSDKLGRVTRSINLRTGH